MVHLVLGDVQRGVPVPFSVWCNQLVVWVCIALDKQLL